MLGALLGLIGQTALGLTPTPGPAAVPGEDRSDKAIAPYVSFLKQGHPKPVDYILSLFDRSDVVILCERWHPEVTQYDLFHALVSDPRFIDKVGNVFTEIGTSSMNERLRGFLEAEALEKGEAERRLLSIYRDLTWSPVWEKHNFFDFLGRLYSLNSALPKDKKIRLYLSDVPFSWDGMTKDRYADVKKLLGERDRIMADQVVAGVRGILKDGGKRKKALVIMNYRHAFGPVPFDDGGKGDNVGRYLFEAFPGRVSNVMLNQVCPLRGGDDRKTLVSLVQDGKWDAAFSVSGDPDVGFDFEPSPFGDDRFDLFPFREQHATYKDIFTGFVFYKPLREHRMASGIPGFLGDGFRDEFFRRVEITGRTKTAEEKRETAKALESLREVTYDEAAAEWPNGRPRQVMGRWLSPRTE